MSKYWYWISIDNSEQMYTLPPTPPTLTDHSLHLHEQVKETRVADGHIRLGVSQSDQLHYQFVDPDSCSRNKADAQPRFRIVDFV